VSNDQRKRGYLRPQPQDTTAFDAAFAKWQAEFSAFQARPYVNGSLPADASDALHDARDAVFSVPAPNGAALARKVELFAYPLHIDGFLSDAATRAKIAAGDDDEEKRLLVMYLDALALSGVTPPTSPATSQDDETPRTPPKGSGRALPAAAGDPAAAEYRAARLAYEVYANGLDATKGMGDEDPGEIADLAAEAMLRTPPVDLSGVATRLGYIVSNAFLNRAGDWDLPLSAGRRELVAPPTDAELCAAGEGQNGGADALFRALANLHLQIEGRAGPPDTPDRAVFLAWEAEAARLYDEFEAADTRAKTPEDEARVERLYDAACSLLRQILETPGSGPTVAAVKLRAMLHPDVGVARLLSQMGAGDAQGVYTALEAITGSAPFNPVAWIKEYEADGGKVRRVRLDAGGHERFAIMLAHPDTTPWQARDLVSWRGLHGFDETWALWHAAESEELPDAAPRTAEQITADELAAGRIVSALIFPPLRRGEA
jgi:hypothetical protein